MRRVSVPERPDWRAVAAAAGFVFHSPDGERYWDESAHYVFTLCEIETDLEAPTAELHALCLEFVARAVGSEAMLTRLAVPPHAWDAVRRSWFRADPSLYGRFDLVYDGAGPAKLLEYNADTPTALYETGVFQWLWLESRIADGTLPPHADQFNAVHDKLVARLRAIAAGSLLHLTCMTGSVEDRGTVAYLEDCARAAGLSTRFQPLEAIGLLEDGCFVDGEGQRIARLFKLYPWEWIWSDPFGIEIATTPTRFVEPPWKALLSNKGLLPCLWDMAPGHPNLLPSFFDDDPRAATLGASYVRKPLFSREGANVLLVDGLDRVAGPGPYGREGHVRQALVRLPRFEGNYTIVGSWVVGDEAAGLCLRESATPITTNLARFLPHIILD